MRGLLLGCLVAFTAICEANSSLWGYFQVHYYNENDPIMGYCYHVQYCDREGWLLLGHDLLVKSTLAQDSIDGRIYSLTFDVAVYDRAQNWVLAQEGDIASPTTTRFLDADLYLAHHQLDDGEHVGLTTLTLRPSESIYIAFACESTGDYLSAPPYVYGWVQLWIDEDGTPSVRGDLDLEGGPMVVGGGAWTGGIPEPSGGMLMLLGVAVLALRRRVPLGRGYIFRAADGTTTKRRLISKARIGTTDIAVGLLESPLPTEYTPAKLLPADYASHIGTGRLIPVLHLNQHRKAFVVELPEMASLVNRNNEIYTNCGATPAREVFFWPVFGHDSGNPCFMLVSDERILLYATHVRQGALGAPGGPHTALYAYEIQAALDTMSDTAGVPRMNLSFADLTGNE